MMMTNIENKELELLNRKIEYLSGFMLPERFDVLKSTLSQRSRYITICTENTFHPQNASALVRNCEAFGIQNIHTVETLCAFSPHMRIVRGTDKWVDIEKHKSTIDMATCLKSQGYRIVSTSPHAQDCTPDTFDVTRGKFALVFGTEHAGISDEMISLSDEFIRIPMCGFVESLNVSASAAILLYELTTRMRHSDIDWHLTEEESTYLLFRWMEETVRDSKGVMSRFRV